MPFRTRPIRARQHFLPVKDSLGMRAESHLPMRVSRRVTKMGSSNAGRGHVMQTMACLVSNIDNFHRRHRQRQNSSLMWDLLTGPTLPQLIYVATFCCFISLLSKWSARSKPSPRSVAILVLGDVGRSPRMMYHAESFAKLQFETFLVGYQGTVSSERLVSPRLSHWPVYCFHRL